MVGDCKIHQSYRDDIKSLKYPEFDFMPALFRGQGYPTLLRIFLRFGIIRYCVPNSSSASIALVLLSAFFFAFASSAFRFHTAASAKVVSTRVSPSLC